MNVLAGCMTWIAFTCRGSDCATAHWHQLFISMRHREHNHIRADLQGRFVFQP